MIYTFPTEFFCYGSKMEKYDILYCDVQNTYMETS